MVRMGEINKGTQTPEVPTLQSGRWGQNILIVLSHGSVILLEGALNDYEATKRVRGLQKCT